MSDRPWSPFRPVRVHCPRCQRHHRTVEGEPLLCGPFMVMPALDVM